jgi:uncharacterized protein (DUF1501 family)
MNINRRDFFTHVSKTLFATIPLFGTMTGVLSAPKLFLADAKTKGNVLVFIHLAGGNDWFNTIIPIKNPDYKKLRPNLALKSENVLKLNDELSLHPGLKFLKTQYDKKELAVLLNYGSREHDLSHLKAVEQISYLDNLLISESTWQKSYADVMNRSGKKNNFPVFSLEPIFCETGEGISSLKPKAKLANYFLDKNNNFEFDLSIHYKSVGEAEGRSIYLEDGFDAAMNEVALAIKNNSDTTVYHVSLGGFDTHENQLPKHNYLLQVLDNGIATLHRRLKENALLDRTMIVITSEFGRSFAENENIGTDHGYLNHALLIGESVYGGIYGQLDLVNRLQNISNESLLSSLFDNWLNCPFGAIFVPNQSSIEVFRT